MDYGSLAQLLMGQGTQPTEAKWSGKFIDPMGTEGAMAMPFGQGGGRPIQSRGQAQRAGDLSYQRQQMAPEQQAYEFGGMLNKVVPDRRWLNTPEGKYWLLKAKDKWLRGEDF